MIYCNNCVRLLEQEADTCPYCGFKEEAATFTIDWGFVDDEKILTKLDKIKDIEEKTIENSPCFKNSEDDLKFQTSIKNEVLDNYVTEEILHHDVDYDPKAELLIIKSLTGQIMQKFY